MLTQTVSASGARYAADDDRGDVVFWIKGKDAMLERPGEPTLDCRIE